MHGGVGEMIGGGGLGWEPGQFIDDNEMEVIVAESLLVSNGFDAEDQLKRFRAWRSIARDVGMLTREVLGSGLSASEAAGRVLRSRRGRNAAGNGSLMRAAPGGRTARHRSFTDVVTAVIDLGDDPDFVAAVAGSLAGARFGIQAIPSRRVAYIHGRVTGLNGTVVQKDHLALQRLAMSLISWPHPRGAPDESTLEPAEITPGLWASNCSGACTLPDDRAVVSLCRIDTSMRRPVRREVFLVDRVGDDNPSIEFAVDDALDSIDALLAERREVAVHCYGGRSRTGVILAAHLMRHGRSLAEAQAHLAEVWPHAHFRNPRFAGELQRRDSWAAMPDSLIARRLGAAPDERWVDLWAAFDAIGPEQVRSTWRGGEQVSTTVIEGVEHPVISMPWAGYSDEVAHLSEQLYRAGVILEGLNWPDWLSESPLREMFTDGGGGIRGFALPDRSVGPISLRSPGRAAACRAPRAWRTRRR